MTNKSLDKDLFDNLLRRLEKVLGIDKDYRPEVKDARREAWERFFALWVIIALLLCAMVSLISDCGGPSRTIYDDQAPSRMDGPF